ncbi:DNA primase [Brevibacillus sp. FIR094]|uniref:DNA primase n=1 Tax=Brevibacillus sp. FIR094 TaxID=3134809 RepID=UPI003D1E4787
MPIIVFILVIGAIFYLFFQASYFIVDGLYQILDNTIFLAIFMTLITIGYLVFYFEGKRLVRKQIQRTHQAVAMTVANRNHGIVSAASFALESELTLWQCEQVLKDLEGRKVLRTSSEPGRMAVYQLDDHVYGHMPYESDDHEDLDDEETSELEQTQRKRKKRILQVVLGGVIGTLIAISEEQIFLNMREYISAAIVALTFLVLIGHYLLSSLQKEDKRHSEHDVLTYVMDNEGELNPKEIPYYTHESYQSMEPMIDNWHKSNYCSITYQEDGGIIYHFPNYTDESEVNEYDEEYDPIPAWIDKRSRFLLFCCLAFVFSYVGGYALVHWNSLIFILACTIIGGIYGHFAFTKKPELERMERIALQVATKNGGAVAVYELAYNARITMDEAATLLEKWEQTNIARKVYAEEGVPIYMVGGMVSQEQRQRSEHV